MARWLGVDPGSVKLGYGLIDYVGGAMSYVEAGVISAPQGWPVQRRLVELWRGLCEVVDEYEPDGAGVEAGFVQGQQGALVSGAARGVVLLVLGLRQIPTRQYAPSSVKKAATGYGAAKKDQVARCMKAVFRLAREPAPDAADALACAIAAATDNSPRSAK